MATDRRHRRRVRAGCALAALALQAPLLLAAPLGATAAPAPVAWWQPLAFTGQRVMAVSVSGGLLYVMTPSGVYNSANNGASFERRGPNGHVSFAPPSDGPTQWQIRNGTVLTAPAGRPLMPDPRSPFLGNSAHLIAAPAALPGVAVAVGADNHVWRRTASGRWATAFILLPAGGLSGIPRVTSVVAFTQPLSTAVYMGTAGYGVLVSQDGGDDWIRADPGLPANVLDLASDFSAHALYAATDSGLYVHHLQALPQPPTYQDAALSLRWLGIAAVALLATAGAILGLRRALSPG